LLACLVASPVRADEVAASEASLETSAIIAGLLEAHPPASGATLRLEQLLTHEALAEFYRGRDFQPLWLHGFELRPAALDLIEHLRSAPEHGLCSNAYLLDELEELLRIREQFARHQIPLAPFNRAVLDLFLSQAFFAYATHLVEGQVDPALAHVDWRARRRKADLRKLLTYAVEQDRMSRVLNDLMPSQPGYQQLIGALQEYREIAARGGWPQIPPGETLRPGMVDERLPLLRQRLRGAGDLPPMPPTEDLRFDAGTIAGVEHFQRRHGLAADGVVGAKTLAALNVPIETRIRQLELNLERWRWLPKSLGKRYIVVNIADFSLRVVEDGQTVLEMPVIVGTPYRKTPVFSAYMTYLEFSPYWTVPSTILREDKLPAIKADPNYLSTKHFRILQRQGAEWTEVDAATIDWQQVEPEHFPGLLRQDPGPWNPLGRVKFMFPNGFNVYLHDTNERGLFENAVRSFSSGCIRVKQPVELALYLLADQPDWTPRRVQDYFGLPAPERVDIEPIPVHIQYWTAWVEADGAVAFRPDVYLRDLDLAVALEEPAYRTSEQLVVKMARD